MTDLILKEKTITPATAASSKKRWLSYGLIGALVFALSDFSLRLAYHPDVLETPYRSWIYTAADDYPKNGPKPEIVILGSSLMVAAVNDGDATTLGEPIDGTTHHRSITLERALAGTDLSSPASFAPVARGKSPLTHSFAIGGQMASDAYAILRTLFNNKDNKDVKERFALPKVIVWGIAPRDLMDATFTDPDISTTVMYLDNFVDNHDALGTRPPYIWRQMEYLSDSLFYSYGQRQHFLALQKSFMQWALSTLHLVKPDEINKVNTPQELLLVARRELPEDNGLHQWMVKPQRAAISQFEDNSKEYQTRYNPFKEKNFNQQSDYLGKFLALAKSLGIKVVLFNMPLTQDNLKLIPEGKYDLYLRTVRELAAKNGTEFVDFNDGKQFTREYFNDYVHLNGYGSQRFFRKVAETIQNNIGVTGSQK